MHQRGPSKITEQISQKQEGQQASNSQGQVSHIQSKNIHKQSQMTISKSHLKIKRKKRKRKGSATVKTVEKKAIENKTNQPIENKTNQPIENKTNQATRKKTNSVTKMKTNQAIKNKPIHKANVKRKTNQMQSSTYRIQRCEFYNKGSCQKNDLCTYSHDFTPETAKKICKFYLSGSCSKKQECKYSHDTSSYPCKFFHFENRCALGINCRFSHALIPSQLEGEFAQDNKDQILKLYKENKLINFAFFKYLHQNQLEPSSELKKETVSEVKKQTSLPLEIKNPLLKKDPRNRAIKAEIKLAPIEKQQKKNTFICCEKNSKVEASIIQNVDQAFKKCLEEFFYGSF